MSTCCLLFKLLDERFKHELSARLLGSVVISLNDYEKLHFVADCFDWAPDDWLQSFVNLALDQGFIAKLFVSRYGFPFSFAKKITSNMTQDERFSLMSSSLKDPSLIKDPSLKTDLIHVLMAAF